MWICCSFIQINYCMLTISQLCCYVNNNNFIISFEILALFCTSGVLLYFETKSGLLKYVVIQLKKRFKSVIRMQKRSKLEYNYK